MGLAAIRLQAMLWVPLTDEWCCLILTIWNVIFEPALLELTFFCRRWLNRFGQLWTRLKATVCPKIKFKINMAATSGSRDMTRHWNYRSKENKKHLFSLLWAGAKNQNKERTLYFPASLIDSRRTYVSQSQEILDFNLSRINFSLKNWTLILSPNSRGKKSCGRLFRNEVSYTRIS